MEQAAPISYWEHFPHGADVGVRGVGPTKEAAFAQTAAALTAVVTDLDTVAAETPVEVEAEAPDDELLLVDWLNALVYEMATRHMFFARFEVEIEAHQLKGVAWGEAMSEVRHESVVEVKGATYTALSVTRDDEGNWVAQCVVDV